jgi:hypothetical protein
VCVPSLQPYKFLPTLFILVLPGVNTLNCTFTFLRPVVVHPAVFVNAQETMGKEWGDYCLNRVQ